jgi:lactoylglutathione lyase
MQPLLNIDVPDLAHAERFYCDAFGLRPGRRLGEQVLELLGAAVPIYLLEQAPGRQAASPPGSTTGLRDYQRHWMPMHCDLVVDDLEQALARAIAAGAQAEGDIRDEAWGRIVQMADPFGHGWCLLSFTAAGYDAIALPPH